MLAIVESYRAGLLQSKYWMPNLIAGLIVGVVALPLAMAFAIASGVEPAQGIYTAIIAAFFVGIFGGSRVQIAGPTGAFIVILASITAHYGVSGLQVATLIAGFILVMMGLLKIGSIVKFIPDPVIVGFTSGIGFIIFMGEWKDFFGLPVHLPLDASFFHKLIMLTQSLPSLNWATAAIGCLSLSLMIITPKIFKKIPGPLVAMIIATCLESFFKLKGVATLGSTFGGIPEHLPHFNLPIVSHNQILNLIAPAFTIAILGAIESLMSATAADSMMTGVRHNSNQELIGQGLANIFSPLFGGIAATGAIARTTANIRNGGTSPIAAIVHCVALIGVILLLAPLAANIPLCSLAAILFVVAYNMSDIPHFIHTLRFAPRYDALILLATFFLTIFTNLVIAVNAGVILAMIFFIRRMHQSVGVEQEADENLRKEFEDGSVNNGEIPVLPKDMLVFTIQGPLFFGVTEKFTNALIATHTEPKIMIFRLKNVPFMDMTGLETFSELVEQFYKRKIKVYLCEANNRVEEKLKNIGIMKFVSSGHAFAKLSDILTYENSASSSRQLLDLELNESQPLS